LQRSSRLTVSQKDIHFIDITDEPRTQPNIRTVQKVAIRFPNAISKESEIRPLLSKLAITPMRENLVKFSNFHNRYYKSQYGAESSRWLLSKVGEVIKSAPGTENVKVRAFEHSWGQHSIIATIPGKTNKTVVIGAHQDSINMFFPMLSRAPGADDDGSGTVTILEALRVLLTNPDIAAGKAENTIEFHWYSAEEGGLLGSQAIFRDYSQKRRDVRAMLQQDMTGFTARTKAAGKPVALGVITDFVDAGLTQFIMKVIDKYCDIPYVMTKCGYACSDHASAGRAGYPSAFIIEGEMQLTHDKIHTDRDTMEYIDFDHVLQHAKLTLALAYELAFAELPKS
jgi:leucyl aminopeptidase